MANRQIRIASLPDVYQWDDSDWSAAIETDAPIRSSYTAVDPDDLVRLGDLGGAASIISTDEIFTIGPYVGDDYPTIQHALNDLYNYRINGNARVRLSLEDGNHNESTLFINHPQGQQIDIAGSSSANCTITFNGTPGFCMFGTKLGSINAVKIQGINIPTPSDVIYSGAHGVWCYGGGYVKLGSYDPSTEPTDIIVDGFMFNIFSLFGSQIYANLAESRNALMFGVVAGHNSSIYFEDGYSHANGSDGVHASSHAMIYCKRAHSNANGSGFVAGNHGCVMAGGDDAAHPSIADGNANYGYQSGDNSFISAIYSQALNNTIGYQAQQHGDIYCPNYYVSGNVKDFEPELHWMGNAHSLITDNLKAGYGCGSLLRDNYTITVPSSEAATIQDAINLVNGFWFEQDVTVRINLSAGVHDLPSTGIEITHPQSNQIEIVGAGSSNTTVRQTSSAHGFVIQNSAGLKRLDALTLTCTGNHLTNPTLHAYGVFPYYLGTVWCTEGDFTQSDLVVTGFIAGICASKNATVRAQGAKLNANMFGAFAAHGGNIILGDGAGGEAKNSFQINHPTLGLQGGYGLFVFRGGQIYADGVTVTGNAAAPYLILYDGVILHGGHTIQQTGDWLIQGVASGLSDSMIANNQANIRLNGTALEARYRDASGNLHTVNLGGPTGSYEGYFNWLVQNPGTGYGIALNRLTGRLASNAPTGDTDSPKLTIEVPYSYPSTFQRLMRFIQGRYVNICGRVMISPLSEADIDSTAGTYGLQVKAGPNNRSAYFYSQVDMATHLYVIGRVGIGVNLTTGANGTLSFLNGYFNTLVQNSGAGNGVACNRLTARTAGTTAGTGELYIEAVPSSFERRVKVFANAGYGISIVTKLRISQTQSYIETPAVATLHSDGTTILGALYIPNFAPAYLGYDQVHVYYVDHHTDDVNYGLYVAVKDRDLGNRSHKIF